MAKRQHTQLLNCNGNSNINSAVCCRHLASNSRQLPGKYITGTYTYQEYMRVKHDTLQLEKMNFDQILDVDGTFFEYVVNV